MGVEERFGGEAMRQSADCQHGRLAIVLEYMPSPPEVFSISLRRVCPSLSYHCVDSSLLQSFL